MGIVVIRADASLQLGTGHVMRCLTLATQLWQYRAEIVFVCLDNPYNLSEIIEQQGFKVKIIQNTLFERDKVDTDASQTIQILQQEYDGDIDLLIIDHYHLDIEWERKLRPYVRKMMVIDDLANRRHDCDILLDQNLYHHMEKRYEQLVPKSCIQLLGPKYALLREEFVAARGTIRRSFDQISRGLIFFGGSDPTNETTKVLNALIHTNECSELSLDVVVGMANPNKDQVRKLCKQNHMNYYCQIDFMSELMVHADFMIGAGGTTTWERLYLELPSITIIIAENQREMTEVIAEHGATYSLGWHSQVKEEMIQDAFKLFINSPDRLAEMSKRCALLMGYESGSGERHGIGWSFAFD
ncbi:UDP-2,4-diacetamido-2,4,6-trideoxy-beta-L-altropyranose hydrolase [Paenibacillus alginolyticus]|uniref:UDP-2,4-diacetamido-2,4, 6-trideoxy-beta-L-altropyranose hydrolase n=1 Tax=Paenibacillus alginolyticus TaxID=59839 RepID=A0ABT4G866_9BACL|nr:UDP-2,4-diacetamido-2,4,6-trideoxy-beta-L-altropyranose hydrolase [Paenibacillus alginolyticus]MCY9692371.1 UDP-2,4-diacetamido-2,4,6-trideoxy-beta-L-altropyranose hydrolase [Paenibacillus alginolyticus]MEC0143656.1 UDP-2,4-diacetamido-2,4,6-trideoxy-beta-L-altropyranose hydrolase [Paenibacillus alginolyticus]